MDEMNARQEELDTLSAIFPELLIDPDDPYSASLDLAVTPPKPLLVRFVPSTSDGESNGGYAQTATNAAAYIEHDVELSHLPPLVLNVKLAADYPAGEPPEVQLSTLHDWLPMAKVQELEQAVMSLWEEYSRCEILFAYIDYLQQVAERGFDLDQSKDGCLVLPVTAEKALVDFDAQMKETIFNAGTYDCGICLEPKRGSSCYQLKKCGHVFCKQCLQDFYNSAITEGDVGVVKCLAPDCGKENAINGGRKRKRKPPRSLHPRELLAMGIEEPTVRRYVEMKRKKKLEADKNTIYCPRTWCQGPARSPKYPPIPADLSTYISNSSSDSEEGSSDTDAAPPSSPTPSKASPTPTDPTSRLKICSTCTLAFCSICFKSWHGPYLHCRPRDPSHLSAEEKASYDYIRLHTSPCPTCYSPSQKTMGCNHMICATCKTHFCYLCGAWLNGANPYEHFNVLGRPCFQRLWELEEGDEGVGGGAGFAGARGWEGIAVEAAREAEAAEQAEAPVDGRGHAAHGDLGDDIVVAMAGMQVPPAAAAAAVPAPPRREPVNGARRLQRNPFHNPPPPPQGQGAANAVRHHERNRGGGRRRRPPAAAQAQAPMMNEEERQQMEIRWFLELARRDEEEGWDSDELGEDDGGFAIR